MNKNEFIKRLKEKESFHQIDDYSEGFSDGIVVALELAEQLEEPETLSEKWIFDNQEMYIVNDTSENAVNVWRLKNLIVPESEKPVVPQFVADWIEGYKEKGYSGINAVFNIVSGSEDLYMEEYLRENLRTFIDAWDNGYTAEEQKYYVLDSEDIPLLERANNQTYKTTTDLSIYEDGRDNSKFELTEQEIKDYDERYWAFAVPVEEEDE